MDVSLQVMKAMLGAKNHSRVIEIYRILRVRGYIGRGGRSNARMTTMATCYGGQAAEVRRARAVSSRAYLVPLIRRPKY